MRQAPNAFARAIEEALERRRVPAGQISGQLAGSQVAPATPGSPGVVDRNDLVVLSNAAPAPLGAAAAVGAATTAARADHVHVRPTPAEIGAVATTALSSANPAALAAAAAPGMSTNVSRADHVHPRPTPAELGAVATTALSSANPAALAAAAAPGVGTNVSRADHVHPRPTAAEIGALALTGGTVTGELAATGDGAGLMTRTTNLWLTPTDHFNTLSGWTWAAAPFHGAPSGVSTTAYPSLLFLLHNSIVENHFLFRSTGSTIDMYARLSCGVTSYIGLRADDGTNNNYYELRLEDDVPAGKRRLVHHTRVAGGAVATLALYDGLRLEWVLLRLLKTPTLNLGYIGIDIPIPAFVSAPHAAWTPTRAGIIFGQRGEANNGDRAGFVDWIRL